MNISTYIHIIDYPNNQILDCCVLVLLHYHQFQYPVLVFDRRRYKRNLLIDKPIKPQFSSNCKTDSNLGFTHLKKALCELIGIGRIDETGLPYKGN